MSEPKTLVAQIEYYDPEREMWIHSDIEPAKCDFANLKFNHKKFLHDCLDEWIKKSNGTGIFYIGDTTHHNVNPAQLTDEEKRVAENFILIPRYVPPTEE